MDKGFLSFVKDNKKTWKIGVLVAVGILLIILSAALGAGGGEKSESDSETLEEYKEMLESELAAICSSVDGVGKCRVFITFARGEQIIYKGSSVSETKPPEVLGVTVVCEGAGSDSVKRNLTEMITALFGIGSNRVAILKLN